MNSFPDPYHCNCRAASKTKLGTDFGWSHTMNNVLTIDDYELREAAAQ